jgi:hypothetical protein
MLKTGLLFTLGCFFGTALHAKEISLFEGNGKPVAYIDTTEDLTIYLWNGRPVAYLEKSGSDIEIYGFNGKHLGWLSDGVLFTHDGKAACATEKALATVAQIEPIKPIEQISPIRSIQQLEPIQPVLSNSFGDVSCVDFLSAGRN